MHLLILKIDSGKKLHGWRGSLLSNAGKEILIKTVAQAVPLYTIKTFLLPKSFCDELNQMVAHFWWGRDGGKWRIHWVKWKKLCKPKSEGVWGLKIYMNSTLLCLRSKGGDYYSNLSLLWQEFSKPSIILLLSSYMFQLNLIRHTVGVVWRNLGILFVVVHDGGWGMVYESIFGGIAGCHENVSTKFLASDW